MSVPPETRNRWWTVAPVVLAIIFALAVLPVVFLGGDFTSEGWDEANAHLPVIRRFAEQLPAPDLSDYQSATGPGYHLLMAVPARLGLGVHALRAISACAGLLLVLLGWRVAARATGPALAGVLLLPLLCSTYLLSGSAWLTTDVMSVLLGSALVASAAWIPPRGRTFTALAVLLAAAVSVRQTNVFLAAPIVAAGVLGSPLGRSASDGEQWSGDEPRSWGRLAWAVLALVPAALLLAALVRMWGGLTPPAFRSMHERGINPVAPVYGLALFGAWAAIGLFPMLPEVAACFRRHRAVMVGLGIAAIAAALLPESSWSREEGRWGGALWTLAQALPAPGGRSVVVVAGAAAGAVFLSALWFRAAEVGRGRQATVVTVAFLALLAVQAGNSQVWERYFDPAVLVTLAWLTALGIDRTRPHSAGRAALGALLLAAAQCGISVVTYWLPAFRG